MYLMTENNKLKTVQAVKTESSPIIQLPNRKMVDLPESVKTLKPSLLRKNILAISAIICVLIPTFLGALYFLTIASDRYAAKAGFSVRSMDAAPTGGDFLGALTGLTSVGSTTTDSYIILKYLTSRKIVERLSKDAAFLEAYSSDKIDFFYRLDPTLPIEDIVKYWEWMITTSYDNSTDLIEFEVQAFTPEDAEKIATLITNYSQELINGLSEQARNDSVRFAQKELASAELRLKFIRNQVREFRSKTSAVDLAAQAQASLELTTALESQLIEQRARLNSLRSSLSEESQSIQQVKQRIASLEKELDAKLDEVGKESGDNNISGLLADYEQLRVEQEFAQQAYTVALSSLERARAEADRQQRFLAVFDKPSIPQDAIYPYRYLNSFLVFAVALILWSIGVLLTYSVRDHMR